MGTFKIVIQAVGGHGVDREKKNGEKVNFKAEGDFTPDAIAERFANELKHFGCNVEEAQIIHWPGEENTVVDDLVTGERTGNF